MSVTVTAGGIHIKFSKQFTEFPHTAIPAFAVVEGIDLFIFFVIVGIYIPMEVHCHVNGLPHHGPVVFIEIGIESAGILPVRTADLCLHTGNIGQMFFKEFQLIDKILFCRDKLSSRIQEFFIGM